MSLEEFEDRIGEIREVPTNLPENVDGAQANLKPRVAELTGRAVEEFHDVGTSRKLRSNSRTAGLLLLRRELPPGQPGPNTRG